MNDLDKEIVFKNYDEALWGLVSDGNSKRKARRILKNVFPEVEYDWKNDTHKLIKDKDMEGK